MQRLPKIQSSLNSLLTRASKGLQAQALQVRGEANRETSGCSERNKKAGNQLLCWMLSLTVLLKDPACPWTRWVGLAGALELGAYGFHSLWHRVAPCAAWTRYTYCWRRSLCALYFFFNAFKAWGVDCLLTGHVYKKCIFLLSFLAAVVQGNVDAFFSAAVSHSSILGMASVTDCLLAYLLTSNTERNDRCFPSACVELPLILMTNPLSVSQKWCWAPCLMMTYTYLVLHINSSFGSKVDWNPWACAWGSRCYWDSSAAVPAVRTPCGNPGIGCEWENWQQITQYRNPSGGYLWALGELGGISGWWGRVWRLLLRCSF